MNILDVLTDGQDSGAVANLARSFGLDRSQTAAVLEAVVPQLTRRMERNTLNRGGVADLIATLGKANYAKALAPDAPLDSDAVQSAGIEVLDNVLWSKDASRGVAQRAARETGVSNDIIKQMLPAIAAMIMGGLSQKAGGFLEELASQFGGSQQRLPVPGEGQPGAARPAYTGQDSDVTAPSAPPAQPMPRGAGDVGTQRPLPIPGDIPGGFGRDENPYGDLTDIIRRGGRNVPRDSLPRSPGGGIELPQGGGSLDTIIRDILGGVLGFQSKGFIGWLVRLILVRWGWGFLQSILRRIFLGR